MAKSEQSRTPFYFLLIVVVISIIIFVFKPGSVIPTLTFFLKLIVKIISVLVLVFIIMFLINYFVTPKQLVKYIGRKSGMKSWWIAIVAGIISTGPIYMWYPMLSGLKDKGVRTGFVATFLYTRAIKPALIPLMIIYFGLMFILILTIVLILFSILQGILTEKILEVEK